MSTYTLRISTPDGNVFDEEVEKLILRGSEGDLAVMAGHIPFATPVKPGKIDIVLSDGTRRQCEIGGGILTVGSDLTVLLSSSVGPLS